MLDVLLFSLIGIFLGFIAGILPGIHPNQFFVLLITFLPLLSNFSLQSLIALVISTAISNVFFNYIPSLFFSLPDSTTTMNVLPGHRMVLMGYGLNALFISIVCAFLTLVVSLIFLPLFLYMIPIIHQLVYPYIHWLLISVILFMIIKERRMKERVCSLLLYVLSGLWGIVTLNSVAISSEDVLFPALTGLFGLPGLIASIETNTQIPPQTYSRTIKIPQLTKVIVSGLLAGMLAGILPGAGEAQAGMIVSEVTGLKQEGFLGALAGINMSNLIFSIVSLYSLRKIRSGVALALDRILLKFGIEELLFCCGLFLFSAGVSSLLTWIVGKKLLKFLQRIDYKKTSIAILIFTVLMVFSLTGIVGLFILFVSTFLGLLPLVMRIKRTSNMGYLMIPTTLYFAKLNWVVNSILF
ncbi:MAG: tripartite tricarboxylate transporter permease [Candidatus Aenigmarchaeota archaeon]|nr:tripartite tricarboxylate transporter permease [Candidatus Aenigmarchaeota archaeon]